MRLQVQLDPGVLGGCQKSVSFHPLALTFCLDLTLRWAFPKVVEKIDPAPPGLHPSSACPCPGNHQQTPEFGSDSFYLGHMPILSHSLCLGRKALSLAKLGHVTTLAPVTEVSEPTSSACLELGWDQSCPRRRVRVVFFFSKESQTGLAKEKGVRAEKEGGWTALVTPRLNSGEAPRKSPNIQTILFILE